MSQSRFRDNIRKVLLSEHIILDFWGWKISWIIIFSAQNIIFFQRVFLDFGPTTLFWAKGDVVESHHINTFFINFASFIGAKLTSKCCVTNGRASPLADFIVIRRLLNITYR